MMTRRRKDPIRKAFNKVKKEYIVNFLSILSEFTEEAKWEHLGLKLVLVAEDKKGPNRFTDENWGELFKQDTRVRSFYGIFGLIVKSRLERLLSGDTLALVIPEGISFMEFNIFQDEHAISEKVRWYFKRVKKKELVDMLAWLWASAHVDPAECLFLAMDYHNTAGNERDNYVQARNQWAYYMTRGRNQYTRGIGSRERTHRMAARRLFGK